VKDTRKARSKTRRKTGLALEVEVKI